MFTARTRPPHRQVACRASVNGKSINKVDVVVAGAGPAGLACALAIQASSPSLSIRVLERAKKIQPCGGNIGLSSGNSYTALEAIGPDVIQAFEAARMHRPKFTTADKDGSNAVTKTIDAYNISWFDLQQALSSQLPPGTVSFGEAVTEVAENEEGVTVGTATGESVRCSLLIGADGNRSAVRAHIQPNAHLEYVGACVWRFFFEKDNPFAEEGESVVLTGDGKVLTTTRSRRAGAMVSYASGLSTFPEERLGDLNQTRYIQAAGEGAAAHDAKLARFRAAFADFKPDLVDYIATNADPASFLEHPMFALDPRHPWHSPRVALVGDAAHTMPPNLSQGTPSALEDAVQLAASLAEHGIGEAALADYEAVRKERVLPVWDYSVRQARQYYMHGDEEHNPFSMEVAMRPEGMAVYDLVRNYSPPSLDPAAAAAAP